jgi:hypothetical protein
MLRSYWLSNKKEFPAAITEFPCAISYPTDLDEQYSEGGPAINLWKGTTQFHLVPNMDNSNLPDVVRFFGLVEKAAKAHMTLGGLVNYFMLERPGSIKLARLQWAAEAPHYGLVVSWVVKEDVTGQVTLGR